MRTRIIAVAVAAVLAIAGAFALVVALQNASTGAAQDAELRPVLVVVDDIPAGTPGERARTAVELRRIPAGYIAEGALADVADLAGRVAAVDLKPGEQVLSSRWVTPAQLGRVPVPPGLQEVSIALDLPRAAGGAIAAGDPVGVFASRSVGGVQATELILDRVLVTAVASTVGQNDRGTTDGRVLVTFALSAEDARRLVFAAEFGTVWLSAQNELTEPAGGADGRDGDGTAG